MRIGMPRLAARVLAVSNVSGCGAADFCSAEREQPLDANARAKAASAGASLAIGGAEEGRNRSVMESSPPIIRVLHVQESHGLTPSPTQFWRCSSRWCRSCLRKSRAIISYEIGWDGR